MADKDAIRLIGRPLAACAVFWIVASCAGDRTFSPDRSTLPDKPSFSTLDDATRTLGVSINGPSHVYSETTVVYQGQVGGGSGNYRYDWLQQYCYGEGTPYCSSPAVIASGNLQGAGAVEPLTVFYPREIVTMRIGLHAWDDQSDPYSGAAQGVTTGIFYDGSFSGGGYCDYQSATYYPIPGLHQGVPGDTSFFRRHLCNNVVEYKPEP